MAMVYELKNRVAVITGASGGIGRECAVEFHRRGCRIFAIARSPAKLNALADQLGDDRIAVGVADITNASQRDSVLKMARERFGSIDILINNAGWASFASVLRTPPDHADRMLALNFLAPLALIQAVLPEMTGRGSGQIVNISSVVGQQPMPRMAVYSATKAALNALTTALRMELKRSGVDVILVSPGSTRTAFFDAAAQIDTKAVRLAETQYTPQRVARAVARACRRRRQEVTLTPQGRLICAIRRVSHRLADRIIYSVSKKAMPQRTVE